MSNGAEGNAKPSRALRLLYEEVNIDNPINNPAIYPVAPSSYAIAIGVTGIAQCAGGIVVGYMKAFLDGRGVELNAMQYTYIVILLP